MEKKRGSSNQAKFDYGELKKIVLAALGIGLVLGGSVLVTPNFPIVLGTLLKAIEELRGIKIPRWKLRRVLKQLEKRQLIDLVRDKEEVFVKVKDKDNVEIVKYSIKELLDLKKRKKRWEGRWFLVVFDVPEKERIKRYFLRKFLKEIGFYPYQQSVYVFPHECKREIDLIKKIVEGGKYANYIIAESLEKEEFLKEYFNLKKN